MDSGYNWNYLFDNVASGDSSRWIASVNSGNAYVIYEFESRRPVNGFGIAVPVWDISTRSPRCFKLEGSNDGTEWTQLDSEDLGETCEWSSNQWRYFRFENETSYSQYRFTVTNNYGNSSWVQLAEMELYNLSEKVAYVVEGDPKDCGEVSPAYGSDFAKVGGAVTFSAFDSWTSTAGDETATCTGYQLYVTNSVDGGWTLSHEDSATSFTIDEIEAQPFKVVWKLQPREKVSVQVIGDGSVTGDGFYDYGTSATLAETPSAGYSFAGWAGDCPDGHGSDNPLTISSVTNPCVLAALFLEDGKSRIDQYVALTGSDDNLGFTAESPRATIGAAVSFIEQFTDVTGTVHVASGVYPLTEPIMVEGPIHIQGMAGNPEDVVISNKMNASWGSQNHRVLCLNNAGAAVTDVTLAKGISYYFKSGGNLCIDANGGTASNCVFTAGFSTMNSDGAAFWLAAGLVTHCKIVGNSSDRSGSNGIIDPAAIFYAGGSSRVENCLFAHNSTTGQSHLGKVSGNAVVRNCTFVDYEAPVELDDTYGGRYLIYATSSTPSIQNCVFIGNHLKDADTPIPFKGNLSCYHNCAYDGEAEFSDGNGCLTGVVNTVFRDYANGDYRPSAGGELFNGGVTMPGQISGTDLLGKPRVMGKSVDIGCYEASVGGLRIILR